MAQGCGVAMGRLYYSVDIEASGPSPPNYFLVSLGACVVGNTAQQFYRELQGWGAVDMEAMRVAARGLKCLEEEKDNPVYRPDTAEFDPLLVRAQLMKQGMEPRQAMQEFREWVVQSSGDQEPVLVAAPIAFDAMYLNYYFQDAGVENPFGHSGICLSSFYKGVQRNLDARVKDLGLRPEGELTHNALEDAVQQAKEMERIMEMMNR